MNRSILNRVSGLFRDALTAAVEPGLPWRKVLDREYMAAWHSFQEINLGSVRTLVDIGAHEGLFARRAALIFPLERAILVEPLAEYARALRGLNLPGATVVQKALADKVGRSTFSVNSTAQASSLREINSAMGREYALDMKVSNTVEVETTTLDMLCEELGLGAIDLVKIDVQGAERELLLGAGRSLPRIRYLQIEVLFVEHYIGCADFFEIHRMLNQSGFRLCRFLDSSCNSRGHMLQADAIYANSNIATA